MRARSALLALVASMLFASTLMAMPESTDATGTTEQIEVPSFDPSLIDTVASPGQDMVLSGDKLVVAQKSHDKRTLCASDNDCHFISSLLPKLYPYGAQCVRWLCVPKCGFLQDWDIFGHKCRDVSSDNDNCGKCGQKCEVTGATGTVCLLGRCYATGCATGYTLGNGVCHMNPSQRARVKRGKGEPRPKKLCPDFHEQACPILGSTTYGETVKHLSEAKGDHAGLMAGAGGYECVDTRQALDSCGGCASTGEGVDCTKIRGVRGVGCEDSKCVVFSCQTGWKPSSRGDKCVKVRAVPGRGRNAGAHAAHRHQAAAAHQHST